MKYQLLNPINPNYSTIEQILTNRHIPYNEVYHYLHSTDADINEPELLGADVLTDAATVLIKHIKNNDKILIVVDCDCDGFTSSALLVNYLYDLFPSFVESNIFYFFHEGKEHGLSDCIDYINENDFRLIIVPDAGSNDIEYHKLILADGIDLIILDHHIVDRLEEEDSRVILINNQSSNYPNKELSGVGIVWQFCRFLDKKLNLSNADYYLDLVALGNTGDMMSLTSIETKHLINKGFRPDNIHNPYIYEMWQKNKFKLGEEIASIDAAFYIVPMINAIQRSGTLEEKILLFNSMLKFRAFEMIDSTKRGHKGELERLVDQAVRTSTNVKNRQTRAQDAGMEKLEKLIEEQNLMEHKVLLFLLEPNEIDKNIAGLIANKIANKYQRPCCILTKIIKTNYVISNEERDIAGFSGDEPKILDIEYQGSARGYELTGLTNFKDICEECGAEWAAGHQNAFGLCIKKDNINNFIETTDLKLANISNEPVYYVDYIYNGADVNPQDILTISELKPLWGKDFDEALVAIKDLKVSKDLINVYKKTSNTLKITLPNKVSLMKFNATDEECAALENYEGAYVQIDVVGRCNKNEWLGNVSPQIFIEQYEITGYGKYLF